MHGAVHGRLFTGSTGSLLRTGRIVHPHIYALDHALGQGDIVTGYEYNLADEAGVLGNVHNLLDEVLAGFVGRVGLTGEEELHGLGGIVHNLVQAVQIAEQQRGTLVGSETTGEADGEDIVTEGIHDGHQLGRAVMVADGIVLQALADEVHELDLQLLLHVPYILVRYAVDAFEAGLVVMVRSKLRAEHLGVYRLPFGSTPGRIVHAVGDVAHKEFLRQIARIHVGENLLGHLAMQHGNTVHVLRDIGGEVAHGELLVGIQRVVLTQGHQGFPVHFQALRIVADILAQEAFVKGIVACRNRRMGGKQRTGAHHFQGLGEVQVVFLDVLTQTLHADERSMALVAVVHLRVQAQFAEGTDTAHAQQEFLLKAVLPVAAIEVIGNLAVFLDIGFIVRIHQVQVCTAHFHLPQAGGQVTARECHGGGYPVAVFVQHRHGGNLGEVLGIVAGHLITLGAEHLVKVTVTIQQAHSHQVHVHVGRFLEVVAGQDTQTAGINLKGGIQTILHTEVRDGRVFALGLGGHIGVEFVQDSLHLGKELLVLRQLLETLDTHGIQHSKRVMAALVPHIRVDAAEQGLCALVPAPPQVLRQFLKPGQLFRKVTGHQDAAPAGVGYVCFKILHCLLLLMIGITTLLYTGQGEGIRLLIILNLMVPQGDLCHLPGIFPVHFACLFVQRRHLADARCSALHHFLVIAVVALQDGDAGVFLLVMGLDPQAETGQRGGKRRDAEGQGLQRSVAPRFIVGREQRQVHAAQKLVVRQVEDAVITVQIGRDEIHLHFVPHGIVQAHLAQTAGNGIKLRVLQIMGTLALVVDISVSVQLGLQAFVRAVMAGRNHDEGLDAAADVFSAVHAVQGVDKHIDSLVPVLVTAADTDEQGVCGNLFRAHGRSHLYDTLAGGVVLRFVVIVVGRSKAVLKAVRGNYIYRTQELGALLGGDVAHRCEYVRILGRFFLQGIDGLYVKPGGHLVPVVGA